MENIKKIKTIERYINELKKDGYNVFILDNQFLIFEDSYLFNKNTTQSIIESESMQIGYGNVTHGFSDLDYTYKIDLL